MSRTLTSLLSLLAAAVLAGAFASSAAAASCAQVKPTSLRFERASGKTAGTLSWKVRKPAAGVSYRVWRGSDVVGQTTKRSLRVNVRIGATYTLRVAPVAGGRVLACKAAKRVRVTYRLPSAPGRLSVSGKSVAQISWEPSRRGDARIAGYRVLRDGAVVKQTRATKLDAPLGGKLEYVFAVVAVDGNGRLSARSKTVRVRRGHKPPAAPAGLTVAGTAEDAVALEWTPSPTQAAGLRYRVTRDGETVGQFDGTDARIERLLPDTSYEFAVQAVDSLGYVSDATARALARTAAHAAPTAPAGLKAQVFSDSEVELSWEPSQAFNGRIVGYRVTRNGAPVGQHAGPSVRLSNLPASTDLTFEVQAADNHGALSAPSTVVARTHDPEPTSGHAVAFLLASTDQSFADFRRNYRSIGTVSPTYYDCTTEAGLMGRNDPLITGWAQARKVAVLPRFNCQQGALLHRILTEPELRAQWLDGIMARVTEHGFDGATLDFEAGYAADRNAYTAFAAELAARLHAEGKKLMMAVSAKHTDVQNHPRSTFFDYIELSKHVDTVFVMAWGIHWATSVPGPQDDMTWVRRVVDYVATMPDPRRFVLGMQLYAMDWANGGGAANPAESYQYEDAMERLGELGGSLLADDTRDALHYSYTDGIGRPHDVWFTDAATQGRRIDLARAKGLGGVGFWRLGREDQRLWEHPLLLPGVAW